MVLLLLLLPSLCVVEGVSHHYAWLKVWVITMHTISNARITRLVP